MFLYYEKLKKHYANLNHKNIADNKQFWKTVKQLLSDKSKSNEKITVVEDNKMISEDEENAELLNSFFSNAVKILQIPEFGDSNPLAENIPHPIFKAILKLKNHPSIIANKNARNGPGFYFCGVSVIGFDLIISEPLKKFFRKAFSLSLSPVSSVLFLFAVAFIFSVFIRFYTFFRFNTF